MKIIDCFKTSYKHFLGWICTKLVIVLIKNGKFQWLGNLTYILYINKELHVVCINASAQKYFTFILNGCSNWLATTIISHVFHEIVIYKAETYSKPQANIFLLLEAILFIWSRSFQQSRSFYWKPWSLVEEVLLSRSRCFYWKSYLLVETIPFSVS